MEWIFDNLFIIVIIVSGLIGFFKNNDKEEEKKETAKPVPPKSSRIPNVPPVRREQPRAERKVYREGPRKPAVSTASVEEQQKAQMERLASKYGTVTDSLENMTGQFSGRSLLNEQSEITPVKKANLKKQVISNLGAKGLVNGIIMSEVLGAPRAKKPFKTIVQDRIR